MAHTDQFGNQVQTCVRNDCDAEFGVHRKHCPECGSGQPGPLRSWEEKRADMLAAIENGVTDPETLTNPPAREYWEGRR